MTQPQIPLFDIVLSAEDRAAVDATLRSGWLTMGPRIEEFEGRFAEHLGVRHAVAVSSGTAALHLAYLGSGIGPGDEVIVPATTFVATANAVRYCGAEPVLADITGVHDLGIDPADVERRITLRTKAVCAVHFAGYPAACTALEALCDEHGLLLVEDAAHSPSATTPDGAAKLGSIGKASAFSFFSNKVLSCGEGGLVATDDDEVATVVRRLRSHAMTTGTWDRHRGHALSYDVVGLGFNYRMDEPRAALLLSRLDGLEADIAARRRVVRAYRERLRDLSGVVVPYEDSDVDASSCYVMPIVLEADGLQGPLREMMRDRFGIQTSLLYPSLADFTAYRELAQDGGYPNSATIARNEVTLPLFPHLSDAQQERVISALATGLRELTGLGSSQPQPL